ncbi:MAG: hypothetical protein GQ574_14990 [Crocinitomix sp.]|nr:hypothetical protein [Crocinitomix sp.]
MKLIIVLIIVIAPFGVTFAQNQFANHWHLGEGVHVDFSLGGPFVDDITSMNTFESTISYANDDGELLFYSNGGRILLAESSEGKIWNRNHEVMPNGNLCDSCGCQSTWNGGVVIPDFDNSDLYHIYMTDCLENLYSYPELHAGLRRTTIDMSLDGGLGDVVEMGVPIYGDSLSPMGEGIAATRHQNGTDYWIITHASHFPVSDTFYVFLLTDAGISDPIIQAIGASGEYGIEISPDGKKLTFGNVLYNFDIGTGLISSAVDIDVFPTGQSFSPNSELLYIGDCQGLYQFDLNALDVLASRTTIYENADSTSCQFGALQVGPNCKIYVVIHDKPYFGVINSPNALGLDCDYINNQLAYSPELISNLVYPSYINSRLNCETISIEEIKEDWSVSLAISGNTAEIHMPETRANKTYFISDAFGRAVLSGELSENGKTIVDISFLAQGLYYIHLDSATKGKKIIKM